MKQIKIQLENVSFHYGTHTILNHISCHFTTNEISAITGASGNGKSTLLSTLNRLWEENERSSGRISGRVRIRFGHALEDIYSPNYPLPWLRRKVGMVFQTPNPLPMSIFKNVALPLKLSGEKNKKHIAHKVQSALVNVALWNEVKDRLNENALTLSGGQQQRLCIARALISEPEVLLLDEPSSSLDSAARDEIEHLLLYLRQICTIVFVSHDLAQIGRVADNAYELSHGTLTALD